MSSLPAILPSAQPATGRAGAWVTVEEAASRMGRHVRHVARMAGERWLADGLARYGVSAAGRQCLLVSEAADPRLTSVKFPEQLAAEFDLRPLTEDHRRRVLEREAVLLGWYEAHRRAVAAGRTLAQGTAGYVALLAAQGRPVSRRTIYNWHAAYRAAGRAGLVDARKQPPSTNQQPATSNEGDPFLACVQELYLNSQAKLSVCHFAATAKARDRGWEPRSYKACQRHIDKLPPQLLILRRQGRKAFEDRAEPAIERDYSTLATNDMWCADHHRFDVMVRIILPATGEERHIRPWLTAWQDMRSRRIVGWRIVADAPNADTILAAFQSAAAEHGLPREVLLDNGDDFDSRNIQGISKAERRSGRTRADHAAFIRQYDARLTGAFNILAVGVRHAWAYHGQTKPIERFFGTLCTRFSALFDTYTGKDTASKPERLAANIAAGRALSLDEFTASFADWVEADYNRRPHSGDGVDGLTPQAAFTANLATKAAIDPDMLRFACQPRYSGPRGEGVKITKQGVRYNGLGFGAFDAAVQAFYGQRVMIALDPTDLSAVQVLGMDGRLLARAKANITVAPNAAAEDLRAAIQEKKKLRKSLKAYVQKRPRMADDMPAMLHRAAVQRQAASSQQQAASTDPPPSIRPVRTPFDDQLPAIRESFPKPLRIAVGAESMSDPYGGPSSGRFEYHRPDDTGGGCGDGGDGGEADAASFRMMIGRAAGGDEDNLTESP